MFVVTLVGLEQQNAEKAASGGTDWKRLSSLLMQLRKCCNHPFLFEGLEQAGRPVRRPDCTLVTVDHNVPTFSRKKFKSIESFIENEQSRAQVLAAEHNVQAFNLPYFGMADKRQGIVHIIGPEQGFTVPGSTCVCGDSHTATHGAFGALAFGIGTSEVEHVLATQTLLLQPAKTMEVRVEGDVGPGVSAKDIILHITGTIGAAGGTGHVSRQLPYAPPRMSNSKSSSSCGTASTAATACSPGTYTDAQGQSACTSCAVGTHQPSSSASGCAECVMGSFCPTGAAEPRRHNPARTLFIPLQCSSAHSS